MQRKLFGGPAAWKNLDSFTALSSQQTGSTFLVTLPQGFCKLRRVGSTIVEIYLFVLSAGIFLFLK